MTNNAQVIAEEFDYLADGFERVPVVERPPKVKWGDVFLSWDLQKQNQYLRKFAEAMNHAAATIMEERDKLGKLLEVKEKQLVVMQESVASANMMLQTEITKMNEYRQEAQQNVAKLNARIRELENGNIL